MTKSAEQHTDFVDTIADRDKRIAELEQELRHAIRVLEYGGWEDSNQLPNLGPRPKDGQNRLFNRTHRYLYPPRLQRRDCPDQEGVGRVSP